MTRADEIQNRCDELKRENGDDRFFTGREIRMLPEVLHPDESLISLCSGLTDGTTWLIVLTDRRIVLLDKGMFWGMKEISIDLNKVNSITQNSGLFFSKITIGDGAAGYLIDMVAKKAAKSFTQKANETLSAIRSHGGSTSRSNDDDRTSQLERIASLRASGALSESEFLGEKRRILKG